MVLDRGWFVFRSGRILDHARPARNKSLTALLSKFLCEAGATDISPVLRGSVDDHHPLATSLAHHQRANLGDDIPWLWTYLPNLRIVDVGRWLRSSTPFTFDHFWSLSVEEPQWYSECGYRISRRVE